MYLSFDIGGTSIKYGLVDNEGNIIKKSSIKTEDNKEIFLTNLVEIINEFRQDYDIIGIGMSAPGIINKDGYMVTAGAIRSLYGSNIKEYIEEKVSLPVTIDNDGNAAAIAEKWLGNAQDLTDYICLVLGTGVGGGIVLNNQIYAGAHGMAGEIGWAVIKELPEEENIELVSLNRKAAVVSGLCFNYNNEKQKENADFSPVYDAEEIFKQESNGEKIAHQVVENFFTDLAIGLINTISFFDPEAILIGGGISNNEEFQERLQLRLREVKARHESLNRITPLIDTPVIMAKLKNDAGLLGATYQIKQRIENS